MKKILQIVIPTLSMAFLVPQFSMLNAIKRTTFATQKQVPATMMLPKKMYVLWASGTKNYTIGVKIASYNYTKPIPGLKPSEQAELNAKKDGFVIYVFDGSSEIVRYHIAGSLLKRTFPKFITFMPLVPGTWTYEFITLENGKMCIYRIWIEKDSARGPMKSVDFGKRVEIAAPSGKAIVASTVSVDSKENIAFKDVDGTDYMWDSTKETVVSLPSTFKKMANQAWTVINKFDLTDTGFKFLAPSGKDFYVFASHKTKKIDPLKVNLDGLKKGSDEGIGTVANPLKIDVDEDGVPLSTTTFQPGQALALLDLLCGENEALKVPIAKGAKALSNWVAKVDWNKLVTQPDLSEEHKKTVVGWIKQVADTVINQSMVTAEIKFRAREAGGIKSVLKKAEPTTEEVETVQNETNIKEKLLASDTEIKRVLGKFAQVPSQKSWPQWFDEINKDVELKVLITYLATAPRDIAEEKMKLVFTPGPRFIQKMFAISAIANNSKIISQAKKSGAKTTTSTEGKAVIASPATPAQPAPGKVKRPLWVR